MPTIPTSDIPTIPSTLEVDSNIHSLPDVTDPGVPAYTWDIGQNEMAILASLAGLAARVTGTESGADLGDFLAPDPIMNLGSHFRFNYGQSFGHNSQRPGADSPPALPLDWANLVVESLQNGLFTAP